MTLLNPNPPAFPAVEYPVTAAEALALNDFRIQQHLIDGGTFQVTRVSTFSHTSNFWKKLSKISFYQLLANLNINGNLLLL